jgi:hypothetical protein
MPNSSKTIILIPWAKSGSIPIKIRQPFLWTDPYLPDLIINLKKIPLIFWHWKLTLKVSFWHFLTTRHNVNSQNTIISFKDTYWSLAKNIPNFVSLCWKLDNPYYIMDISSAESTRFTKQILVGFKLWEASHPYAFTLLAIFHEKKWSCIIMKDNKIWEILHIFKHTQKKINRAFQRKPEQTNLQWLMFGTCM